MSGVFGIVDIRRNLPVGRLLSQMGDIMSHKPWYVVESHYDEQEGLGLGRIGIGILNQEIQPVVSEDKAITLFMAGEFYNHQQIRQVLAEKGLDFPDASDAELALRLYQDQGNDFVKTLEGVFAIAIWDRRRRQLLIANDRFGLKPLYYAKSDDKFIFAPEIKGILVDQSFPRQLNLTALAEYLRFQQLLGEKTFFDGVALLPPASIMCLDLDTFQLTRTIYWDWRTLRPFEQTLDMREVVEETTRLLHRAVNVRLERAERPGIFLSGGLDARTILALTDPQYQPITTVTYGHRACRDVYLAAQIARAAKTQHNFFELKDGNWVKEVADFHMKLVEGSHSWIHAHGLSILPKARELIDINLTGFGAGVLTKFFIRPLLVNAPDEEALTNAMYHFYTQQHSWPGLTEAEAKGLYTQSYGPVLNGLALDSLKAEVSQFDHPDTRLRSFFFNMFNHDRRMIFNFIIFQNSHLENRLPYCDYHLVDWAARLPLTPRANKYLHRSILSQVSPRLALIPQDKDYRLPITNPLISGTHALYTRVVNRLGKRLSNGASRPTLYADYENYLRYELRDWAESILFDDKTLDRGIFRPEALRSLMDRHISGHEAWTIGKIAPIITFEMMMRQLFDETSEREFAGSSRYSRVA